MARPPLPLGHHGAIKVTRDGGQWVARCRVRDLDGVTRRVARWGSSRTAALGALQDELRQRRGERTELLRPHSRFRDAAALWMAKITERREDSTADTYRHWLEALVLPQLGGLQLHECDVAHIDAFFSRLEQARRTVAHEEGSSTEKVRYAANTRRTIRAIVAGVLQQAVLHQAIPSNPVRQLERIESPKGHHKAPPRGLTPEERRRLFAFVDTDRVAVGADLPDLIRFAIGSGLRIGELCAVRWLDLNLDGIPVITAEDMRLVPVVAVRQNVYPVKGKGLAVHGGKTATALRIVPLPELVTTRLRARRHGDENPEWPAFPAAGRNGQPTYRWPANVRRTVRRVRDEVGLGWMTPHTWRRTYATILDDEMTLTDRAKADLMGQAKFLKDTYVSRGELHPDAAVFLDAALR
ncbi:MAG TPA: tyrosine-type recombinase/integrase [Pseudonocardiaceae bacterium]|jgi:integrase|nr:tyrosine-type recombinase/integrase [Pseudonocardiaceae bacterium]